jgi:hypothetical protein
MCLFEIGIEIEKQLKIVISIELVCVVKIVFKTHAQSVSQSFGTLLYFILCFS